MPQDDNNCKNAILCIDNATIRKYTKNIVVGGKGGHKMSWKEKVTELMNQRKITQKQLSQLSGITESSISRYLHSEQRPRMDIVVNIAKALHVETEYLLEEDEKGESAYSSIATAIARKGNELTAEEKNQLIALILGANKNV